MEVAELEARRTFGLVDEEHLPGAVGLPHAVVRRGSTVMFRDTASAHVWTVPEGGIGEQLGTIAQTGGGESEVRACFRRPGLTSLSRRDSSTRRTSTRVPIRRDTVDRRVFMHVPVCSVHEHRRDDQGVPRAGRDEPVRARGAGGHVAAGRLPV